MKRYTLLGPQKGHIVSRQLILVLLATFITSSYHAQEDPRALAENEKKEILKQAEKQELEKRFNENLDALHLLLQNEELSKKGEQLWSHWTPKLQALCPNFPITPLSELTSLRLSNWFDTNHETEYENFSMLLASLMSNLKSD